MKDPLEEFVHQNRAGFDDKEPSKKVWRNIEKAMAFEKRGLWDSVMLWRAAAIVFMALSGYLLIPENRDRAQVADASLNDFKDVEAFYVKQISEKVGLIDEFHKSDGLNGFTQDFQRLEAMYLVLKDNMKSDPSKQVQEAMVLNLLVRIDLLNQQLYKLEQEYSKKNEKAADDSV